MEAQLRKNRFSSLLFWFLILATAFPSFGQNLHNKELVTGIFTFSGNSWLTLFFCFTVLFILFFFFKRFTQLRFENFESYTSHNEIIVKIRTLGILSLLLFPLVEFYESVYLGLYLTNWVPVLIIMLVSAISLALSFNKNLSFRFLIFLPQASYYLVYALLLYKSIAAGMLPVMAIETACLILFSKLIFNKLKTLLYFLAFAVVCNVALLVSLTVNETYRDIYLSAAIQASIVSITLFLIEGSANRKSGFGSKILESSNLFVMVADKNANFIYSNSYLEQVTGITQNEIIKQGWWRYMGYSEETTSELKRQIIENIHKNRTNTYESTIIDKHGNIIYISWDSTVIEEKYLLAVGKNITEARLLQIEEERRKEKIERYGKVVTELTHLPYSEKNNLTETLEILTRKVAKVLGVERVAIWNYEDENLACRIQYLKSPDRFEVGEHLKKEDHPVYFAAISKAKTLNVPDVFNDKDTQELVKGYFPLYNIKSLLDTPIFIGGQLKGLLCCEQTNVMRMWDHEDINFVKAVSDFIALSFEAEKRKELEREYRYILNNAGDIIYTTNALGNFNFINKTAINLLGYDLSYLKGKHFTSIIHPDYQKKVILFYLKQFKQRTESTYCEFKALTSDGREYWVGQNVKLVIEKDDPGKIKGFQAVVRDINKQKETELALIESENNFRQINETIEDVFWLYDLVAKKYIYISPSCEKVLGMSQEDFYNGKSYGATYVLSEDLETFRAAEKLLNHQSSYEIEYRIKTEDGKIKWINEKSSAIRNERGELSRNSGICRDITKKKKQEEQLKQLSLVAQTVSNGVVITNSNGEIEWCNKSFLDTVEYDLEELVGKRPRNIFSGPETNPELKEQIILNKNENSNIEILQYTKTGKQKWFIVTTTAVLYHNGKVDKYVEVITDVTERKALEHDYQYILNNAGDIIYTTDSTGYVNFLNDSVKRILGYAPEELVGKHFSYIIHPDDKKRAVLFYLRQFSAKTENSYYEFRVLSKDGTPRWVGQNVKLIIDAQEPNKINGFQSILRNITQQKVAEHALIESENNFRQINETINEVFYLYNITDSKYEYVSPNARKTLGVGPDYFYRVNNYISDYVVTKDRDLVMNASEKAKKGEAAEIEYRIWIDQEISWISEKSFPIIDDSGKVIKISGTCIDITQKKMQEKKLLRINKELSITSEDLAINNLLKEQLIYTTNFEEIARVSLNTLKIKIPNTARGSLFLVDETNKRFIVYYLDSDEVKIEKRDFKDVKAYQTLLKGKRYIEKNIDLSTTLSASDIERRKQNIISYILLPINYSSKLVGALALGFESTFSLGKREMNILESYTSVLSVVVNKLNLQNELSNKSKDIVDSLRYAKDIQQSIFPNILHHKDVIKSFVSLYIPKDVVSGDFYLIEKFDEYTVIALGDCTGHGVPGAFLTFLGSNILQRILVENKSNSPAQILELLDYEVINSLNKNRESRIRDGMELGICIYDKKNKILTFAGAGLFLVYYKNNQQYVVQGNKRSIGDENHINVNFIEESIELDGTEKFYMFSDGYRDQLGGEERRKRYSRAKFLALLNKIKNLPAFQQEYLLKMEHSKYKGKHEQTDDISIIGFELK